MFGLLCVFKYKIFKFISLFEISKYIFTYKTSNLYGLPKIHKSTSITTAIKEQNADYIKLPLPPNLKFRPIVAGPASPTHPLCNFVDIILKPLCKHVPSYIRDDFDFLKPNTTQSNRGYHIFGFIRRDKSVHQHSSRTGIKSNRTLFG